MAVSINNYLIENDKSNDNYFIDNDDQNYTFTSFSTVKLFEYGSLIQIK